MPALPANGVLLALGLGGISLYFTVQTLLALALVWRCFAMRASALLTWPAKGPGLRPVWLGLGVLSAALMVAGSLTGARWLHVYSQGIMAFYFLAVPRLSQTIRLGLYRTGIWTETSFVPYDRIARFAFVEAPAIILMLVPRGSARAVHLTVPGDEYGTVRKILHQQTRDRVLRPDGSILGLGDA
jgi:hypothetical protein